jgi:hypothetical protein
MGDSGCRVDDPVPGDLLLVIRLQIAARHGIPSRFLVQILLQLKGAGLVASTRGVVGGTAQSAHGAAPRKTPKEPKRF